MTKDQPDSPRVPASLLARVPKVDLHLHLAGTLRPVTLSELARRHDVTLPRPPDTLYVYRDFYDFIDVLRLIARSLRRAADFERVVYEAIEDAARSGGRHLEISFNPQYFMPTGVPYRVQLEGLVAGIEAARRDFGCSALLIAALDRGLPLDSAEQTINDVLHQRHELVVGVGLDGPERDGPPATMVELYRRMGQAGLKRTAHVCEDNQTLLEAPPSNVDDCLDLLGCDRLDHGYNLLEDSAALSRARERGVYFCVCGITSVPAKLPKRLKSIKAMANAGLALTLNTDDPAMFHTDLTGVYDNVINGCCWGWQDVRRFSLAGVDACWLPESDKKSLRLKFEQELRLLEDSEIPHQ